MDVGTAYVRGGLAAVVSALALVVLAIAPASAAAINCEFGWAGGGPSGWGTDSSDGEFDDALLLRTGPGLDEEGRSDAFDGYGQAEIDGSSYSNPNTNGCVRKGRVLRFPADEVIPNVRVRPELYVSSNRPMGRQLVTIRNTGNVPLVVDFGWDGDLGSDSGTRVARTSNGNAIVQSVDRWATSCEDFDGDGCNNVAGEADRDPELAHNWERRGKKSESADSITLSNGSDAFDVGFNDVRIRPGKSKSFMQIVHLAPTIQRANKFAAATDRAPAYVYAGLTKAQRRLLQNW